MGLPAVQSEIRWPASMPQPTKLAALIHRRFQKRRVAIVNALLATGYPDERRQAIRLADCCRTAGITLTPDTGEAHPWLSRCRSRLCPFCAKGRSAQVAAKLQPIIADMADPRHITLTYRSRRDSLKAQLISLGKAFRKLRATPEWKARVAGAPYTIEITRNPDTGLWHPHIHVIADCTFFPQKLLAALWTKCMPGGLHVWIRRVDDPKNAAWEVSKYVSKPPDAEAWTQAATVEYTRAVASARMLQTFGSLHAVKAVDPDKNPDEQPDHAYIPLPAVAYMAAQGVPVAQDLAALIWSRWPMFRPYLEEVCPPACYADTLQTNWTLHCPRPPPLPDGRHGPITDPADLAALDNALHLTCLLWIGLKDADQLRVPPDEAIEDQ